MLLAKSSGLFLNKGFNTQITRLPFDNLGVAVLTNDHTYGGSIMEIIKYRLLDEALGLKKIDWNNRYDQ